MIFKDQDNRNGPGLLCHTSDNVLWIKEVAEGNLGKSLIFSFYPLLSECDNTDRNEVEREFLRALISLAHPFFEQII